VNPFLAAVSAPVWAAQGMWLALSATRLPEAPGPREGRVGAGRFRLLILGDSSAAGVGADRQERALAGRLVAALADLEPDWRLVARTGATTGAALAMARALPPGRLDAAVLALGVNDVTRPGSRGRWLARQEALLALLRERHGAARLYLSAVPPMGRFPAIPRPLRDLLGARAGRFDTALRGLAAETPGARHLAFDPALLDPALMAADGYHPGPALYTRWAEGVAAAIRADFAPPPSGDPP